MGFHPPGEQLAEVATICVAYLFEKSTQDKGLFKTTPNMTEANWLYKGLAKGMVESLVS